MKCTLYNPTITQTEGFPPNYHMNQFIRSKIGQRVVSTQKRPFQVLLMARTVLKLEGKSEWIQVREKESPHPLPPDNILIWGESVRNSEDVNMNSKWAVTHSHHLQTHSITYGSENMNS